MVDTPNAAFVLKSICGVLAGLLALAVIYFDYVQDQLNKKESEKALAEERKEKQQAIQEREEMKRSLDFTAKDLAAARIKAEEAHALAAASDLKLKPRRLTTEQL